MRNLHLRRLIGTAVFLAISLVFRMQAFYLPLFGSNDARIGVHGAFTIMPALLFGPVYGAMASGLGDLLGHFMRPSGAWLWQITVFAAVGGYLRGWLWRVLRGRSPAGTRGVVVVLTLAFLVLGMASMVQLRRDGITRHFYENVADPTAVDTAGMSYMGRLVISRTQNTTRPGELLLARIVEVVYAPLGVGGLGLILLGVDLGVSKGLRKEEKAAVPRLCEERSDPVSSTGQALAIQEVCMKGPLDCFASLAKTAGACFRHSQAQRFSVDGACKCVFFIQNA